MERSQNNSHDNPSSLRKKHKEAKNHIQRLLKDDEKEQALRESRKPIEGVPNDELLRTRYQQDPKNPNFTEDDWSLMDNINSGIPLLPRTQPPATDSQLHGQGTAIVDWDILHREIERRQLIESFRADKQREVKRILQDLNLEGVIINQGTFVNEILVQDIGRDDFIILVTHSEPDGYPALKNCNLEICKVEEGYIMEGFRTKKSIYKINNTEDRWIKVGQDIYYLKDNEYIIVGEKTNFYNNFWQREPIAQCNVKEIFYIRFRNL